mmetsp:Transcript_6534/g.14268  ORF Transcript_6534/g.14268 Transcript_6534/m.14268 type:complete len:212 (+) Transcript_6534:886-1521(+)
MTVGISDGVSSCAGVELTGAAEFGRACFKPSISVFFAVISVCTHSILARVSLNSLSVFTLSPATIASYTSFPKSFFMPSTFCSSIITSPFSLAVFAERAVASAPALADAFKLSNMTPEHRRQPVCAAAPSAARTHPGETGGRDRSRTARASHVRSRTAQEPCMCGGYAQTSEPKKDNKAEKRQRHGKSCILCPSGSWREMMRNRRTGVILL